MDSYSPNRKVWTSHTMPFFVVVYDRELPDGTHRVEMHLDRMKNRGQPQKWFLTILRPDEIEALRTVINEGFDIAMKYVVPKHNDNVRVMREGGLPDQSMYRTKARVFHQGDQPADEVAQIYEPPS